MKIKKGQKYIVSDSNTVFGGRVGIVVDIETYPHDTNDIVTVDEFDGEDTAGFRVGLDIDLSGWAFDTCPYFSINELKPMKTKRIAYAYPSSTIANDLGFNASGCYFVEIESEPSSKGYVKVCQELLDEYEKAEGEQDCLSLKFNPSFYQLP